VHAQHGQRRRTFPGRFQVGGARRHDQHAAARGRQGPNGDRSGRLIGVHGIAGETGGRPVQHAGGAARRQGRRLRITGPQLGQQREDLLGRLALAENHFRDARPPSAIHVQQRELAQRDARRSGLRSGRHTVRRPVRHPRRSIRQAGCLVRHAGLIRQAGCPRHAGILSRHG